MRLSECICSNHRVIKMSDNTNMSIMGEANAFVGDSLGEKHNQFHIFLDL